MNTPLRILVVDDDRICRQTTMRQLTSAGHAAEAADGGEAALARLAQGSWDVVLTDLRMPRVDGMDLLREVRAAHPDTAVILMTAFGTVDAAVAAMHGGAADFIVKPFRFPELELRLDRIADALATRRELRRLRAVVGGDRHGIVGESAAIRRMVARVALFADHAAPVLITGETGTGKELVARALHDASARSRAPFVAVACGAVPRELAESSFLGHERGAFTGAAQRRKGVFEQADGGMLLLDDVDDLPQELQVKLLRVLQEGVVTRVGGTADLRVDVRMVATTKVDLADEVANHRFRSDLYYRLRGLEIAIPPLRDREDDVLLIANHLLRQIASAQSRPSAILSPETAHLLRAHRWPGNVRELRRTMETADALSHGGEIRPEHLPDSFADARADGPPAPPYTLHLDDGLPIHLAGLVRQFEDDVVSWALRASEGSQTRAAELLGVPRTTLQGKLGRGEDPR